MLLIPSQRALHRRILRIDLQRLFNPGSAFGAVPQVHVRDAQFVIVLQPRAAELNCLF